MLHGMPHASRAFLILLSFGVGSALQIVAPQFRNIKLRLLTDEVDPHATARTRLGSDLRCSFFMIAYCF